MVAALAGRTKTSRDKQISIVAALAGRNESIVPK